MLKHRKTLYIGLRVEIIDKNIRGNEYLMASGKIRRFIND